MSNFETIGDLVRAKHPTQWTESDMSGVVDAMLERFVIEGDGAHARGLRSGYRAGLMLALELVAIAADQMPEKP